MWGREPSRPRQRQCLSLAARFLGVATAIVLSVFPHRAFAYRPFTSTDADVVNAKEIEIEFGYLTIERNAGETSYIAPSVVLNYGLSDTLELIGEFVVQKPPNEAWEVADPGIFLKALLKRGALQDQSGLSVAMEAGALLPTDKDDNKDIGGEAILIASGVFAPFVYHINLGGGVDRAGSAFWKWGAIGEVPVSNSLTLVSEIAGEDAAGAESNHSALFGARFQPTKSSVVFDMGARRRLAGATPAWTATAGLTFGF